MPKFMLIYKGEATDMSAMSEDERNTEMQRWEDWMTNTVGDQLVEPGSPFAQTASVVDDGSNGTAAPLTGYTIVSADDLHQAKTLCKGHPFLAEGKGNFAVDVFEMIDMGPQ